MDAQKRNQIAALTSVLLVADVLADRTGQPSRPMSKVLTAGLTSERLCKIAKDGNAVGWLPIPDDVQLGAHELVVSSVLKNGSFNVKTTAASVVAPIPWWVPITLGAAVLTFLAAAILAGLGLLRRRRSSSDT